MKAQKSLWSPEYIQKSTDASIPVGRSAHRCDHTELRDKGFGVIWQHSTDHVGVLAGLTLATTAASSLLPVTTNFGFPRSASFRARPPPITCPAQYKRSSCPPVRIPCLRTPPLLLDKSRERRTMMCGVLPHATAILIYSYNTSCDPTCALALLLLCRSQDHTL